MTESWGRQYIEYKISKDSLECQMRAAGSQCADWSEMREDWQRQVRDVIEGKIK